MTNVCARSVCVSVLKALYKLTPVLKSLIYVNKIIIRIVHIKEFHIKEFGRVCLDNKTSRYIRFFLFFCLRELKRNRTRSMRVNFRTILKMNAFEWK